MTMSVGYNAAAQNSATKAGEISRKLGDVQQVMGSGLRVNNPSQDPASAAVGALLKSDVTVFQQLIRNTSSGISVLNYVQAALGNVINLLTQMKGMATQAKDTTLSSQLANIQLAYNALAGAEGQIFLIGSETSYLGTKMLDGTFTDKSFQVGLAATNSITVNIDVNIAALTSVGTDVSSDAAAAYEAIEADIQTVSGLIATIAANQTQMQAALDQLVAQLGSESAALETAIGADIGDTANSMTTLAAQLQIAQAMIQAALEQQKALAALVSNVAR